MELSQLLSGIPHKIATTNLTKISSITIDSREVRPGTLFICIRGLTVDGHSFIEGAVESGAVAVLVDEEYMGKPQNITIIKVKNTREAMAYIAANYHGNPSKKLRFIGVTGTNGKTTVTNFAEEILRICGRKTGLIGTVGAKINNKPLDIEFATSTTPDPLEMHAILAKMADEGVQDVVMEVSSHALALYKMAGITFDVSAFTNLTQDHLDFHGNMKNYRLAKAKLFSQSKFAVVNADDKSSATMLEHLPKSKNGDNFLTYSIKTNANLQALHIEYLTQGSVFYVLEDKYTLPVNGRFNIYNALAAAGIARALGIDMKDIKNAIAKLSGVPGRIQSVPNDRGFHVLVDYAHSPDGLENIIPAVREFTKGKVITIFGCGGDRDRGKRPIMGTIAGELSDYCILTSDNPRTENPMAILKEIEHGTKKTGTAYEVIESRRDAIIKGVEMLTTGDALIIAGKGHEDYQIIGEEKLHFSDYEEAVRALEVCR